MARHDAIQWTPELEENVLNSLESGLTIRKAAEENGISHQAILRKVVASPSFADQYARSIEIRTESDFERLVDLVFEEPRETNFGTIDGAWVNLKRLQTDTIKWALSKRNPKKYGERTQHDVTVNLSLSERLKNAEKRIADSPSLIIEADISNPSVDI